MAWFAAILILLSAIASPCVESSSPPKPDEKIIETNNRKRTSRGRTIKTLAESIKSTMRSLEDPEAERIRRQYWRKTFDDIEKMSFGMTKTEPFFGRWKQLLEEEEEAYEAKQRLHDEPTLSTNTTANTAERDASVPMVKAKKSPYSHAKKRPRFEGFPSWDRMVQEWANDVNEYMMQVERESGREYMLANYGRPTSPDKLNGTTTLDEDGEPEFPKRKVEPYVSDDVEDFATSTNVNGERHADGSPAAFPNVRRKRVVPSPPKDGEPVLPHTDLSDKSKRIEIVTTACLPWKTGTAVNPLLRAAYMLEGRKEAGGSVTLTVPWLERKVDQERVYGADNVFDSPEEQEEYVRSWLRDSANMPQASEDLNIRWYTAWQNRAENSLYSMGDITALIPAEDVDIVILEEPEHLNWYRAPGESWTKKFKHVVGILHTNYFQYALDQPAAIIRAPGMRLLCSWMCRAHCNRIIKLSGTIDKVAPDKELVENVHGVRETFLEVGEEVSRRLKSSEPDPVFGHDAKPTIYFIGKMLWSKGLGSLMELLKFAGESANIDVRVDMFGGGPDKDAAEARARALGLDMPFHGPLDHGEIDFTHKIFVNPSTSEVLCTTSAEALAMGKFVILPSHVSNDFFAQFPNCLSYASKEEFVGNLFYAMTHAPEPLSKECLDALSWKAATKRLELAGCIPMAEAESMEELHASKDGGVEIPLPPLVEDEKRRKQISTTFRYTRHRFRQFRSRLSSEIRENRVLPKKLREKLAADLEKQLDLDIDEVLESPSLRLRLSPAELDKSLLELYDTTSAGPAGDVVRVIGGGGAVGMQNFYMRRQAMKQQGRSSDIFPFDLEDFDEDGELTTSQWIRKALRRNLPSNGIPQPPPPFVGGKVHRTNGPSPASRSTVKDGSRMSSTALSAYSVPVVQRWSGLTPPPSLRFRRAQTATLLI